MEARITDPSDWLGVGVYTLSEAARLLSLSGKRVSGNHLCTWAVGRPTRNQPPVFQRDLPPIRGHHALSFLDLIEFAFIRDFRKYSISLRAIRKAITVASGYFEATHHPLCLRQFATDGQTIFATISDEFEHESMVDLVSQQVVFEAVFRPLLKQLSYDLSTNIVSRWRPLGDDSHVIVDPNRRFGDPVLIDSGVPTQAIISQFDAGDTVADIADWFEINEESVESAMEFERKLAA